MYRHGDRTEKQSYPKDPFFDKAHWPEGFGTFVNVSKVIFKFFYQLLCFIKLWILNLSYKLFLDT